MGYTKGMLNREGADMSESKKYTADELREICAKHIKWLRGEEGGERANLQRANLRGANLRGANLQGADLQDADLQRADLQDADLQDANLQRADLWGADLQRADLQRANLQDADLWGADLQRADLQRANLQDADLQDANLQRANLRGANLQGADLDFSCLPLWCGGSRFKADARLVRQILAHIVTIEIMDADDGLKIAIEAIKIEAHKSHRASDLGLATESES
jgi:hypothetical protein